MSNLNTPEFRYNSGYRDAVNAARRGLVTPWDTHHDDIYVDGYLAGKDAVVNGTVAASDESPWAIANNAPTLDLEQVKKDIAAGDESGKGSGDDECLLCRKALNLKPSTSWVHLRTDLKLIPIAEEDDHQSQGLHPIGPTCSRKLRALLRGRGENPKTWLCKLKED